MPVKSKKQLKMMYAAAAGKLKGSGPSPEVAKEFINKTSHKKKSMLMKRK